MDSTSNFQLKANALEIIQNYRVPDLQALLKYARISQQGNKRELLQRCKVLISSNVSSQLLNKVNQIEITRINSTKSHHSSQPTPLISPTPPVHNLALPNQIQYVSLPFYEKMRTIDCTNVPIDWNSAPPLRFILTDFDVELILKGLAKVFLRIAPTIISEKQNDVLPPYIFIQCNGQVVVNNNVSKTVGSQAHSTVYPTDITDKLIPKAKIHNTLNYTWLQSPVHMQLKNLPKSYTLAIQLVRCIPLDALINHILKRELQIRTKDNDIEIEDIGLMTTQHRVSLICPITQSLIVIPVKSSYCSHSACFDLRPFLQMNQKRLLWTCPICKKCASYDVLYVDKRLQTVLSNVPANCSTVEIDTSTKNLSDCQYILDNIKSEKSENDDTDHSDDDENEELIKNSPIKSRRQSNVSDCIVLSSEGEGEEEDEDEDEVEDTDVGTPNDIPSIQSLFGTMVGDRNWEDLTRYAIDLVSFKNFNNNIGENFNVNGKRTNSSISPSLSNNDNQPKRMKQITNPQVRTSDVDVITLSSSDSSDNDDDQF